jgi:hypothetical protein
MGLIISYRLVAHLILRSSTVSDGFAEPLSLSLRSTLFARGESESYSKSVFGEPVLGAFAARSKRGVGVVGGLGAVLLVTKGVWNRGVTLPNGAGLVERPVAVVKKDAVVFSTSVLELVFELEGTRLALGEHCSQKLRELASHSTQRCIMKYLL